MAERKRARGSASPRRSRTRRPTEWWELVDFTRYPEDKSSGERLFLAFYDLWLEADWPPPTMEEHLWPGRKRRSDFYWEPYRLAVEIEGGAFSGGRHTRGLGFVADCWKYNDLVGLGIWLLRFTPDMLKSEPERCRAQLEEARVQIAIHQIKKGGRR